MRLCLTIGFSIAFVIVFAGNVSCTTFYVDVNSGSDVEGNGSSQGPWKTITHALADGRVVDLDIIKVAPGYYTQTTGENFPLYLNKPVSLIGAGREKTFIVGNGEVEVVSIVVLDFVTQFEVRGFHISRGALGIAVTADPPGQSGFATNLWIYDNAIEYCNQGLDITEISSPIVNNIVSNNQGDAIRTRNSSAMVFGNVIANNTGYGIICDPRSEWPTMIIHNTLVGNQNGIACGGDNLAVIANNIVFRNEGYGIEELSLNSDPEVMSNCIRGNRGGDYLDEPSEAPPGGKTYTGAAQINTFVNNGANEVSGNISKNPSFVGDEYFHLLNGSKCVDRGRFLSEIGGKGISPKFDLPYAVDIDGDLRPSSGERPDLGVDEVRGPHMVSALYFDKSSNDYVDSGDVLLLQFDQRIVFNGSSDTSYFYLGGNPGSDLGYTEFQIELNQNDDTQLVLTIGQDASLQIDGVYDPDNSVSGAPSGIDISSSLPSGTIKNFYGVDAVDLGVAGEDDSGVDIDRLFESRSAFINISDGGTIELTDSSSYYTKHKLIIPPNSIVGQGFNVVLTLSPSLGDDSSIPSLLIEPADLQFDSENPATLVLEYKSHDVNAESVYLEKAIRIHQYLDTGWEEVPGTQSVDTEAKTVTAFITQTSITSPTRAGGQDPYGNIGLATIGESSKTVAPTKSHDIRATGVTIEVMPYFAVYTKHNLFIPDYSESGSGITITLKQLDHAEEKHDWVNNALLKITSTGEPASVEILTLEYKDDADPEYDSDVINGTEEEMRIHRWDDGQDEWVPISGEQTVDTTENTVSASLTDGVGASEIYSVGVPVPEEDPPLSLPIHGWRSYE